MIANRLETLVTNGPGRITRRQSTFWEIALSNSVLYRIHFQRKKEFSFHCEEFPEVAVYTAHPLLIDYVEEWKTVYLASTIQHPEALIAGISDVVAELTANWRSVNHYLNSGVDTRALFQSGNGLLLAAPRTIADAAAPLLAANGVAISVLKGRPARGSPRVLTLGSNFVIAESFEVTARPPNKTLEATRR